MQKELPLKDQMLHRIRATGRSDETFKSYWYWCEKYIRFVKDHTGTWKHPRECSRDEVEAWLSSLANGKEWVSKNTQNLDRATASKNPLEALLANPAASILPFTRKQA